MITRIKHFLHLVYLYILTRVLYVFNKPPIVLTSIESLKIINKNNLSVARYGDGEFCIINGKSIKFQEYSEELANRLKEILFSNSKKIAICIPSIYKFNITRSLKYNEEIFWLNQIKDYKNIYLNSKYRNKIYYDACLSRPYIRYKNNAISKTLFKQISKLWNNKDILIVEGKYSRLGVGNDLFDNSTSIKRILCPIKNAFSKYDEIYDYIIKYSNKRLVLIALGPTATVLAYDLAKNGIRAIDLGHLDLEYEWYLNGATERELVKNKIVNELNVENEVTEIKEKKYLDSILIEFE